jgi:5-methylcytosine-specific restriction endonuclease McrA
MSSTQKEAYAAMSPMQRKEYNRAHYLKFRESDLRKAKKRQKVLPWMAQAGTHNGRVKQRFPDIFAESEITTRELGEYIRVTRGTECAYCGQESTQIDHIQPMSLGGAHSWDNLQMICKPCNFGKGALSEADWLQHIQHIIRHNT